MSMLKLTMLERFIKITGVRDRSLFMAGVGAEEKMVG